MKGARLGGTIASINRRTGVAVIRVPGGTKLRLHIAKSTRVAHADGRSARAADLRKGTYVDFDGATTGDGVVAASIRLFDRRMDAGIVGRSQKIAGGLRLALRVAKGQRVRVVADAATRVIRADGTRGSLADLKPGTAALVDGVGGVNRIVATRIRLLASRSAIVRTEGTVLKASRHYLWFTGKAGPTRAGLTLRTLGIRANGAPLVVSGLKAPTKVLVVGFRTESRAVATFVSLR